MAVFKRAADLNYTGFLMEVSKWHFRGLSNRKIASEMGCSEKKVRVAVSVITDQCKEVHNVQEYLSNVIDRTMEELGQVNELRAELWKVLDFSSQEVVEVEYNSETHAWEPKPEFDPITGTEVRDPETGRIVYAKKPRRAGAIPGIVGQLAALSKQRAELLRILGPKVDISVKLQMQQQTQLVILERIQELAPDVYAQIYREIEVLAATMDEKKNELTGGIVIDADFEEVDDEPLALSADAG